MFRFQRLTFSSPEPTILLVCTKDRDLWQGPKQKVRESRTSGFWGQPQKFETITVTIGYKNGQLLRLRVSWPLPEVSIPGADQKDRGLWGREWTTYKIYLIFLTGKSNSIGLQKGAAYLPEKQQ